jgi:hypothetical protein
MKIAEYEVDEGKWGEVLFGGRVTALGHDAPSGKNLVVGWVDDLSNSNEK